jgi:hypothetical protein
MLRELLLRQESTYEQYLRLLERASEALEQNDFDQVAVLGQAHRGLSERITCYQRAIVGWSRSAAAEDEQLCGQIDLLRKLCLSESAALQVLLRERMTVVRKRLAAARRHLAGRPARQNEPTIVDVSR